RIAPTLLNCLPSKTEIDQVGSLPMVTLFRSPLSSAARIVKRAADLIIASLALLILAPLWLLIALLIKLDSRGAVFYKQERVGMSIVGPRPPIPYEVESYELWHRKRLDMKPGITGLWQVSGRNRLAFDEMVRMDLYYIENWSLLLDFKIILQTLPVMWRGEDAY